MKLLETVFARISKIMSVLATWLVLALILLICVDVGARYLFNSPISWVYEMSYILGAFVAALGISQLTIEKGNVRVDMFYVNFSRKVQLIIDILFGAIVFIPGYSMVTYAVLKNTIKAYQTSEASAITTWYPLLWPIKSVICLGLVMFVIQYVIIVIKNIAELLKVMKEGENNVG